jgi:hypothetical protein
MGSTVRAQLRAASSLCRLAAHFVPRCDRLSRSPLRFPESHNSPSSLERPRSLSFLRTLSVARCIVAMIVRVIMRTELGPSRALPTARHARVALRHPPSPRAVRTADPHARRRVGPRLSLRLRAACSHDAARRPSGGRRRSPHRWTRTHAVRGHPSRARGGSGTRDSTRGTSAGCAAGAALPER